MITEAILDFFAGIVEWLLGLLPELPVIDISGYAEAAADAFRYASWFNGYVPLFETFALVAVLLAAWPLLYLARFVIWALTKAHILGGSS